MLDLFANAEPWQEPLAPGAVILRRFVFNVADEYADPPRYQVCLKLFCCAIPCSFG